MAGLVKQGHKPYDVEKAVLRASVHGEALPKVSKRWEAYSLIQIAILVATILLALFYHWSFFFPIVAIIIAMIYASMGVPKVNAEWRKEYGMIPGIGLWTRDGIFGYDSTTGNYWRWRVLDPAIIVSGLFLYMALANLISSSINFWYMAICVYLSVMSGLSFKIKPADATGPPYNLISND